MQPPGDRRETVMTPGMKRRGVVRVLKQALKDAERDSPVNRVIGVFGILVTEKGEAQLLSAIAADQMAVVLEALPHAVQRVTEQMKKSDEKGN
jgi:hypothetical protein